MTDQATSTTAAQGRPFERRVRPLREGEVMGAYMEFDRTADRSWTPAEYLVRYGLYVSQRTVDANEETMTACQHSVPSRFPCDACAADYEEAMRQEERRAQWHAEMRLDAFGA